MKDIVTIILVAGAALLDYFNGGVDTHALAIAPALLGALIAAGTGLAKAKLVDEPKEKRQRKLKAIEIALSPFTNLQSQTQIQEADPFGSALGFGSQGFQVGSGLEAQEKADIRAERRDKQFSSFLNLLRAKEGLPPEVEEDV